MIHPYLLLKTLHGMLAALTVVALIHPVFLLSPSRIPRWSLRLTLGITLATGLLGMALYPSYRETVKPSRLWEAPWAARLFETKEHLGFYVLVLVAAGCLLALRGAPEGRQCLRLALGLAMGIWGLGWILGSVISG